MWSRQLTVALALASALLLAPLPALAGAKEKVAALAPSGVVLVIDEKGNVAEPKVVKTSNDAFSEPAMEALKKWKFKPAKKDGEAVAIRVNIPVQFNIE